MTRRIFPAAETAKLWCPYARSRNAAGESANRWLNAEGKLDLSSCLGMGCPKYELGVKDMTHADLLRVVDTPVEGVEYHARCTA